MSFVFEEFKHCGRQISTRTIEQRVERYTNLGFANDYQEHYRSLADAKNYHIEEIMEEFGTLTDAQMAKLHQQIEDWYTATQGES